MTKNWIVVDLDGTLCDCSHRVHWAQAKQWDEFHSGIMEDRLHEDVARLIELFSEDCDVMICTGRNERYRDITEKWMSITGIAHHISAFLMRPDEDFTPDHELKVRLVADYFGSINFALGAVLMVLDDRDKVVQAWRDAGFRCWQVAAGAY